MTPVLSLRLVEVALPFRRPFSMAKTTVRSRRTVLVGLDDGTRVGWGEAAPFPGVTAEGLGDVWDALVEGSGRILLGDDPRLPPTAAAAVDEARLDLAARAADTSLAAWIGGSPRPIPGSAAIAITPSVDELVEVVAEAVAAGFGSVKLKIRPGWDLEPVRAVRDTFPDLRVGLDANGAYTDPHDPILGLLDRLGPWYLEQPLPAEDLGGLAFLRDRLDAPICLDESVTTPDSARAAIAAGAGDIICVKPGWVGPVGAVAIHDAAAEAGLGIKATGLLESGIGRAHTIAVGCLPSVTHHDLAPSAWYLTSDVVDHPFSLVDGRVIPPTGPGIGVVVDESALAEVSVREAELV